MEWNVLDFMSFVLFLEFSTLVIEFINKKLINR